jgi:hypothetical protein
MKQFLRRVSVSVVVVAVAVSSAVVLRPMPASAQASTPFGCSANYYLARDQADTQLSTLNIDKAPVDLTDIGAKYADGYNAMGFRVQDGYIYAYDSYDTGVVGDANKYVRIAADGSVTPLAAPTGVSIPNESYLAGDFDAEGYHNMFSAVGGTNTFVVTDVTGTAPDVKGVFALTLDRPGNIAVGDIAFNPRDGKFYGVDNLSKQVVMISIDKSTPGAFSGSLTHLSTTNDSFSGRLHGAAFIDSRGRLVTFQVDPGTLYRMNIGVNGSGNGAATKIGDAPTVVQYDGASCPYVPLLEKDADPRTVPAGAEVTYTYTMYNPLPATDLTFNFSDTVDQGRTYVGGTLSNTFGGTANTYGDTNTITITGMTVAKGDSISFSVKVKIPLALAGKTVLNQAIANNFSVPSLVSELRSDDPTTVIAKDPTQVAVTAGPAAALGAPDTGVAGASLRILLFSAVLFGLGLALAWAGNRFKGYNLR